MPNLVFLNRPGLQILGKTQNSEVFPIFGFMVNPFCRKTILESQNSTTSNDIDMKLEPVTKLDKKNIASSNKTDDDVMSGSCDVFVIFPIYGQFEGIRKPDSGRMVCPIHHHKKNP